MRRLTSPTSRRLVVRTARLARDAAVEVTVTVEADAGPAAGPSPHGPTPAVGVPPAMRPAVLPVLPAARAASRASSDRMTATKVAASPPTSGW
ncbi:hypothetical protein ASF47_13770 [Nocardioides sp. Leaf285]|nr:hypothetical protein ASF47_13770 [Nocardioides sp. Leaf285]